MQLFFTLRSFAPSAADNFWQFSDVLENSKLADSIWRPFGHRDVIARHNTWHIPKHIYLDVLETLYVSLSLLKYSGSYRGARNSPPPDLKRSKKIGLNRVNLLVYYRRYMAIWYMAAILHVFVVVVGGPMRPRAMPLAMLTMKKDMHGFPISVSGFVGFLKFLCVFFIQSVS